MKLARPDVFHPRIVLAGCPQLVEGDGDDAGLVKALRNRGLHARWLSWDDPQTLDADLVILRATWDYAERRDEFLAWASRVRNLLNAPAVVTWNSDKHYLRDLADAGVPTIPSYFFEPGDPVRLPKGEVVVKPAIGAGSIDTGRFVDPAAARTCRGAAGQRAHGTCAALRCPRRAGETALVFLGGRRSHAFTKGPMLPPQGESPVFTGPAPTSRSRWRRLIRTSRCGMSASPRSRPPLVISASRPVNCSMPESISSATPRTAAAGVRSCRTWAGLVSARRANP